MNVLGQGQGLLAAKLDDVLEKITDSMEMTELASLGISVLNTSFIVELYLLYILCAFETG